MPATAIFTAEASKFFEVTRKIRAEYKALIAEGGKINLGGNSSAEIKSQQAAAKSAAKQIVAEGKAAAAQIEAAARAGGAKVVAVAKATGIEQQNQIKNATAAAKSGYQVQAEAAKSATAIEIAEAKKASSAKIEAARVAAAEFKSAESAKQESAKTSANSQIQSSKAVTQSQLDGDRIMQSSAKTTAQMQIQASKIVTDQDMQMNRAMAVAAKSTADAKTAASKSAAAVTIDGDKIVASSARTTATIQIEAAKIVAQQDIQVNRAKGVAAKTAAEISISGSKTAQAATNASTAAIKEQTAEINRQIAANRRAEQETRRLAKSQREANAVIKQAGQDTGFLAKATQRFGATVLAFATGYLVIQGLGAAFGVLKDALYDFPAALEQTRVGFVGLFGGGDEAIKKAAELEGAIKKLAIPTPYEIQDLAPLAQQTLAFDLVNKAAKDASAQTVEFLRDAGDAAYGLGRGKEGVDRLVLAFGQMKVATRVMGQEMLQMQQLGLNAWKYLSEGLGVTTAKARDLVSDGLVPATQAIAAIRAGIRRDFGGAMERASQTAIGAISQIRDSFRVFLSDEFRGEFTSFSKYLVSVADYVSSNAFKAELKERVDKIREALSLARDTIIGIYDTIQAIGPKTIGFFIALSGAIKGNATASMVAFAYALNTLTHWDEATGKAKLLTAAIIALGVATTGIKLNTAINSAFGGVNAAMMGTAAASVKAGNITASTAAFGVAVVRVRQFASMFKAAIATFGVGGTLSNVFGGMVASISPLVLWALPALVAALGVGGTMFEKYKEKAEIVRAANMDMEASFSRVNKAFDGMKDFSRLNARAGAATENLKQQFNNARQAGTTGAMNGFINNDLSSAKKEILIDAKLRPFEKRLLEAEIEKLQGVAEDHQIRLQAKIDAEELNKGWFSLKNFGDAFYQTFGGIVDFMKMVGNGIATPFIWAFDQMKYTAVTIWAALKKGFADLVIGIKSAFGDLWYSISGGFDSGLNKWLRHTADVITGFNGRIIAALGASWTSFINWAQGKSANYGETEGPSLPGTYTEAELKAQKEANKRYKEAQAKGRSVVTGFGVVPVDKMTPSEKAEASRIAQRNKDLAEYNKLLTDQNKIPKITLTDAETDKEKKKTKAEREKESAEKKAAAAAKKLRLDQLADTAAFYSDMAKMATDSAKRQMKSFESVRDSFRNVFEDLQSTLLKEGIINNPLKNIISSFERWIALTPKMRQLAIETLRTVQAARQKEKDATNSADKLNGGDGRGARDVGGIGVGLTEGILAGIKTQKGISNCANVASQILQNIGVSIGKKPILGAEALAKKVEALGAKRISAASAAAGDLIVWHNEAKYGARQKNGRRSGYHVAVSDGQGGWVGNSGGSSQGVERGKMYDLSHAYALQTGGSKSGMMRDAARFLPGQGKGSINAALSGAGINAESELAQLFQNIDGSISRIREVPKAWGKAVRDTSKQTAVFSIQTQLANADFQDMLWAFAGATTKTGQTIQQRFDQIIKKIRETSFAADSLKNSSLANVTARQSGNDLDSANRIRGKDDPISILRERMTNGDLKGANNTALLSVYWKTRRNMINDATKETRDFVKAEKERMAVTSGAASLNIADTQSLMAYTRALDISSKRAEIKGTKAIQDLLKGGEWATASSLLNEQMRAFIEGYDSSSIDEVTRSVNEQIASMKDQGAVLEMVNSMVLSGAYNQGQLAAASEASSAYLKTFNDVLAANRNTLGEWAAMMLAGSEAKKVFDSILSGAALDNDSKKISEYNSLVDQTTLAIKAAASETDIYFSGLTGPAMERALAIAKERARLEQESASGRNYSDAEIDDRISQFSTRFDAESKINAAQEYAKVAEEAARAIATWGDNSGLASLKFEMEYGALQSLTRAQKDQLLVNQASIDGTQKWADEYKNLTDRQLSLAREIDSIGLELKGSPVTASDRQRLEWKYEDLAVMNNIAQMTDAQKEAYLRQKVAVDSLRESVLGLLDNQQSYEDFLSSTRDLMGRLDSIWGAGLDEINQGHVAGFFSAIAQGVSDLLNDISKQILSAAITKMILGWFPEIAEVFNASNMKVKELTAETLASAGAATAAAAAYSAAAAAALAFAAASAITGGFSGSASGSDGGVIAPPAEGSSGAPRGPITAAIGLNYVPYDGANIIAHRGEAVLARPDAEVWRGVKQGVFGKGSGSSSQQAQSVQVTNIYQISNLNMPDGTDANTFADGLQERTSDSTNREKTKNWLGG